MKIQFWFAALIASCSSSYAAERPSLRQNRGLSESDLDNIDMITYSFNALSGVPASEQRRSLAGEKIWTLTPSSRNGILYTELSDISKAPTCEISQDINSMWYIRSESALSMQSEKKSTGFHYEVDLGVEIPVEPVTISAETTIKNSFGFGNSRTSQNAFKQSTSQYEQSFQAHATRISYSVEVNYDLITSWTDEFMDACSDLGNDPDVVQMIHFFKKFGTHGIRKAAFGMECSSSLYLGSEQTLTSYNEFISSSKESGFDFLFFSTKSESKSESVHEGSDGYRIKYQTDSQGCIGQMENEASCFGNWMQGVGVGGPTIVDSMYFPIWDMKVPTLSQGAKNNLLILFHEMTKATTVCADIHCNSRGVCAPKAGFWEATSNDDLIDYLDGSKCFCFDDFRDDGNKKCAKGRAISVSTPSAWGNYLNSWDAEINYMPPIRSPLCGIQSEHHLKHEDRRFKVRDCNINDAKVVGEQTTFTTKYHEEFELQCDVDKVITGLYSVHNDGFEDRRWHMRCSHFENTIVDETSCTGFSGPLNEYDKPLNFTCPLGKVLHKFGGWFHVHYWDRIFKFDCCELMYHKEDLHLLKTNWSPYVNEYDKPLAVTATFNGSDGAFCGMSSRHHNHFEDRQFRFKGCFPPKDATAIKLSETTHSMISEMDAKMNFYCPDNHVLTRIYSWHSDETEDRQWGVECHEFSDMVTNSCYETQYVNYYDEEINFECGSQHVLAGIHSVHDNNHEDRMWSFTCCRWTTSKSEVEFLTNFDDMSEFQLYYAGHVLGLI